MKVLLIKLVFILALGNPESSTTSSSYSESSGDINLATLHQVESLIRKKAGAELEKNHENSFVLNGYDVYTEVSINRFGPCVYEESFTDIENPENVYRMRLVKTIEGDIEFAVMINGEEGSFNYHAVFDSEGNMLEYDPWGKEEGYTIKTFDLYKKYRQLYSQKVDKVK